MDQTPEARHSGHPHLAGRLQYIGMAAFIGLFLLLTRGREFDSKDVHLVTDLAWSLAALATAIRCLTTARTLPKGPQQVAWKLFGGACLVWCFGMIGWSYQELVVGRLTPFPTLTDAGFLLFAPLMQAGMLSMKRKAWHGGPLLLLSKLGIIGCSLLFVHIYFFITPLADAGNSFLYNSVALAYPVLYMTAMVCFLTQYRDLPTGVSARTRLLLIAGMMCHAITVSLYAYRLLGHNYHVGDAIDVYWLLGFALIYWAAQEQAQERTSTRKARLLSPMMLTRLERLEALLLPTVLLTTGALVTLNYQTFNRSSLEYLIPTLIALIFFIALREYATSLQTRQISRQAMLSEQRFEDMANNSPGLIFQYRRDAEGNFSFPYIGPKAIDLFGIDAMTLMLDSTRLFASISSEDRMHFLNSINHSTQDLSTWEWDGHAVTPEGLKWIKGQAIPHAEPGGEVIWNGILYDISSQKIAERKLEETAQLLETKVQLRTQELDNNRKRLQLVLDNAVDAIVTTDKQGIIETFNPAAEIMFGYAADEIIGRQINLLMPDREARVHDTYLQHYLQTRHSGIVGMDRRLLAKHKSGHCFPIEIGLSELKQDGELIFVGMIRDISEQVAFEQQLKDSERRLKEAQKLGRLGSYSLDIASGKIFLSDESYRILGRSADNLSSTLDGFLQCVHNDDVARLREELDHAIHSGQEYSSDYRILLPDGELRWVHEKARVQSDEQGKAEKIIGTLQDISERKLGEMVLQQAKDEAEKANRVKSEFLASMSHELRTPMNAIIGFTELVQMDNALSGDHQRHLGEVLGAGHHLLSLINDILDLSRIDAGKLEIRLRPVDVEGLFLDCLSLLGPLAQQKNISVSIGDCHGGLVLADPLRIKQTLINLLTNGIKYNRENGRVQLNCARDENDRLQLIVSDSGQGIAEEHMDSLFRPFERAGMEKSGIEGTGIGLYITKKLVEAMGGEISVSSQIGIGSRFIITLPSASRPDGGHSTVC